MADTQRLHTNNNPIKDDSPDLQWPGLDDLDRHDHEVLRDDYYEGLDEIERAFAHHNTCDHTYDLGRPPMNDDGTRTYKLAPADDVQTMRLVVLHLVQSASRSRPEGFYWLDQFGLDRALVRWVQGMTEETVCLFEFAVQRVLFLKRVADAHIGLMAALEQLDGWNVYVVDGLITPACPACAGAGCVWHVVEFDSTRVEGSVECQTCKGEGVLR
jgi:hypothetical protein